VDRENKDVGGGSLRPVFPGQSLLTPGCFQLRQWSPSGSQRFRCCRSVLQARLNELERGISTRFTFDPREDRAPVWSPDGSRVAFASNRGVSTDLYHKISSGAGNDELLLKSSDAKVPCDWSPDGRLLLYGELSSKTRSDLWVLPFSGDRKPISFLQTEFNEEDGAFSPDGKWIAYASDESGRYEVYVQTFPASGAKWQISKGGGTHPKWRGDGKELFYLGGIARTMMAVEVKAGATFQAGNPQPLFETRVPSPTVRYAVTRDGQRFLVPASITETGPTPVTVVINWMAGIKR
jgi:Tol biopolymer transport system component